MAVAVTGSKVGRERKLLLMPKRRNEAAMLPLVVDCLGLVHKEWGGSGISEFEGARLEKSEE